MMSINNWIEGGRILTQYVSSDTGAAVTSLLIDNEWIIVGMADSKIYIFDAKKGLFLRTLTGHSSGVRCLSSSKYGAAVLIEVLRRWMKKWQMDSLAFWAHHLLFTAATVLYTSRSLTSADLNLIHHDPRSSASSTLSPESRSIELPFERSTSSSSTRYHPSGLPDVEGRSKPRQSTFDGKTRSKLVLERSSADMDPDTDSNGKNSSTTSASGHGSRRGACLDSEFASSSGSVSGFSNPGALVVSGGCDRDVRVWDVSTGECLHVLRGHSSTVRCLRVVEGRPRAISGSRDSTVRIWNVETGQLVHLLAGHHYSVRCLDVAENKVTSASYDCTCRVWDVDTGECDHVLHGRYHQIYAVVLKA